MHLNLKNLIYSKCMTLLQFSKMSGIPYNAVHALANNKRQCVTLATIEKLCKALNCTPNDLIKMD